MLKNKGITLIALIITIIILLILAGITIGAIRGNDGLINQAGESKEDAEIANEKELIENATVSAMGRNKYGNLEEEEFQNALDSQAGEGKTTVTEIGESFEVFFTDSNRNYEVDSNGNIGEILVAVTDSYPGDITKDENGNTLTGNSEDDAYQINCIEDLVAFSNMVNGTGKYFEDGQLTEATNVGANSMQGKYIVLATDLNFKSSVSYIDSKRTDFGDINGNSDDGNSLITEMTTGTGFTPIGGSNYFGGTFNGTGHEIKNIYINTQQSAGLFAALGGNAKIENLKVSGNITSTEESAGGILAGKTIADSDSVIINNCENEATVISLKKSAGGIVGYGRGVTEINNCYNYGEITSNGTGRGSSVDYEIGSAGGIIGSGIINSKVDNCGNEGSIYSSISAGGIIGDHYWNFNIINCFNKGKIEAITNAGGIAGETPTGKGNIYNCYNLGNILSDTNSGGIIGCIAYNVTVNIYNCFNSAPIEGTRICWRNCRAFKCRNWFICFLYASNQKHVFNTFNFKRNREF